jgi:hypothetical protein
MNANSLALEQISRSIGVFEGYTTGCPYSILLPLGLLPWHQRSKPDQSHHGAMAVTQHGKTYKNE